ncbi:MAG: hypothetical protein PHN39_02430, partial [Candidatus Pacebacteria bacterium]|nr:hypothetical protein [Candidatus Paceibacterota bacterium]
DTNDKLNCWHSAFAVVRIQDNFFEWAQICDCLILVIYQNGDFKLLVNDYDHDAEALRFLQQSVQRGEKDPRAMLEQGPFLQIWQDANKTYGVLDGDEKFISFLNFGSEALDNVSHILIFSDGLFIPAADPNQPDDFQTLVKLFLEGGLNNVKEFVRGLENSDPECKKYLRFKQHDDITAIAISF